MGETLNTVNIEVDDEVFASLQAKAQPLIDTPNDVLRRLLAAQTPAKAKTAKKAAKAAKKRAGSKGRGIPARQYVRRGTLVPESDYVQPILQALVSAGGSGKAREIITAVGKRLEHKFKAAEYVKTATSEPRWENRARDVRIKLVKQGLIRPSSETAFGVWEITAEGRRQISGL